MVIFVRRPFLRKGASPHVKFVANMNMHMRVGYQLKGSCVTDGDFEEDLKKI